MKRKWSPGKELSKHFTWDEVKCHGLCCADRINVGDGIYQELLDKLEALRDLIQTPIMMSCCYRCPIHNKDPKIKGDDKSRHLFGAAADIYVPSLSVHSLAAAAHVVGFVGIGYYVVDEFVHVSVATDDGHREGRWPSDVDPSLVKYWRNVQSGNIPKNTRNSNEQKQNDSSEQLVDGETKGQPPKEKHFSTREFMCPDCLKLGRENVGNGINSELINLLEQLRSELGDNPIIIKLGYVCEEHQQTVQTPYSANDVEFGHLEGRAADIIVINTKSDIVATAAEKIGFYKVIVYNDNVVHVEIQPKEPSITDMIKEQLEWRRIKREREKSAEQTATEKSVADASKLSESQSSNETDVSSPMTLANMRLEMPNWMKNGLQDTTEQETAPKFNLWLDGKLINPDHVIIEAGPPKHTEGFRVLNFDVFTIEFD